MDMSGIMLKGSNILGYLIRVLLLPVECVRQTCRLLARNFVNSGGEFVNVNMSDVLKTVAFQKYKDDITVDNNNCLRYVRRECAQSKEIYLTVHITNRALKSWNEIKTTVSCTYIEILNSFLAENHAVLDNKRIEELLRRIVGGVTAKFKGKRGRDFLKFSSQTRKIAIQKGELQRIGELKQEIDRLNSECQNLEETNETLEKRCRELYRDLLQAQTQTKKCFVEIEKLKEQNVSLHDYIDKITESQSFENTGRTINN